MKQARTFISATGIGIGGYFLIGLWSTLLLAPLYFATGRISFEHKLFVNNLALAMGAITTTVLFLRLTDYEFQFLNVRSVNRYQLGILIGSVAALLIGALGMEVALEALSFKTSEHRVYEAFTTGESPPDPMLLLALIPMSILIIGPSEEIIFRGLVQASLYRSFERRFAILITSTIFAVLHFPVYLTTNTSDAVSTLLIVLFLSLVLGWAYEQTENIIVPSLAHGIYNGILFLLLYIEITNSA